MTPGSKHKTSVGWRAAFFETSTDLICTCVKGEIFYINSSGVRLLDAKSPRDLFSVKFAEFLHPDYVDVFGEDLLGLADESDALHAKLTGIKGRELDVEIRVIPLDGTEQADALVIARDITERLRVARQMVQSETRHRNLVQKSLDALILCDGNGIKFANQAGLALFNATSQDELMGRRISELLQEDYREILSEGVAPLLEDSAVLPVRAKGVDGKSMDLELAFIPLEDDLNGEYMIEGRDITRHIQAVTALRHANEGLEEKVQERTKELRKEIAERMKAEEIILKQATYDSLTELPNRMLFFERLQQEIASAEREKTKVDLMFIDLDGFKLVNDTLGHDAGDLLLQETARRLNAVVRKGDTVCRLGGDEFTVILPHLASGADVEATGRRILNTLAEPFDLEGHPANVSGSIGISVYPDDANGAEELVKCADSAMYRAKQQGKANYQFFTEVMNQQAHERETLSQALSQALGNNEFHLLYQPKINLIDGQVSGVEALLRWESATLGTVVPSRFIPVLEETVLMSKVGEWVARTAMSQLKNWASEDLDGIRVAINVSARQLRMPGFCEILTCIIEGSGLPPDSLELELQEGILLSDINQAAKILGGLKDAGLRISIDDFGTGFSSLNYLQRLPIDAIKVDRTLVSKMDEKEDDRRTVKTIIDMAHGLGRQVVAEGVENPEQLALLKEFGCDEVQGYLFSPPIIAENMVELAKKIKV